ncbi:MAG: hypothetical protein RR579_01640 [Eubacterium sp.]
MDIFDQYAKKLMSLVKTYPLQKFVNNKDFWPTTEKNPFMMERDTAVELGGYPKESINLMISSSNFNFEEESGVYLIGNPAVLKGKNKHLSFGKIVLLETEDVAVDTTYEYLKSVEFADIRLRFCDVMVRMSSQKMFTNLRIGKTAMKKGFTLEKMGWSMYRCFSAVPQVKQVKIILILGDNPLYKELLPVSEKIKDITGALNTMFDGIDFNCKSCNLNEICAEVEGLKKMHKATSNAK